MERRKIIAERRAALRAPFVAAVRQRVGSEVQLALAQNVGERGIELRRSAGRVYLPRTPVSLQFELPDGGAPIRVLGSIIFERPHGTYQATGVRFESISPADRARLSEFVGRKTG